MNADVLYSVAENGLATVTMNRPSTHYTFNNEVIQLIQDAFERATNDISVRALLIQAQGSSFCAGGAMNWMKQMANYSYEENLADSKKIAAEVISAPKPNNLDLLANAAQRKPTQIKLLAP